MTTVWRWAKSAGAWYSRCLSHSPYTTNCVTGFVVAGAGDAFCQRYFEQSADATEKSVDKRRMVEMGLIRAAIVTPFTFKWYTILARISPGTTLLSALKRVVVDQAIGSPIVISLVFIAKALLAGDPKSAEGTIKESLVPTWLVGLQYWPIMHTINFRFVPLMYQPLYASMASLYWNAVLSYYAYKDTSDQTCTGEVPTVVSVATQAEAAAEKPDLQELGANGTDVTVRVRGAGGGGCSEIEAR